VRRKYLTPSSCGRNRYGVFFFPSAAHSKNPLAGMMHRRDSNDSRKLGS